MQGAQGDLPLILRVFYPPGSCAHAGFGQAGVG